VATYRVQLNKEFDFNKLKAILPYLSKLGISHVYASPIFKARCGSLHGYDATDSNQINEELGGPDAFNALLKEAAALGLEWIQDIVPNHIAYSPESTIVSDILKFGSDSNYYDFLDVDWNHPSPRLRGKILAPFLKESYEKCLRQGQINLSYHNGFQIKYGDLEFPVKISSYRKILSGSARILPLPFHDEESLFSKFQQNYNSDEMLRSEIGQILNIYNRDITHLDSLLSEQVYALANWRTAFNQINYRRFFDIIDLICLRMEKRNAFETTHRLILHLLSEHKIAGLRVDHIDGLHDPKEYLNRLRKEAPHAYIVVEKILQSGENLPELWPVEGTTGYDFLNKLNGIFIAKQNKAKMTAIYKKFTGSKKSFNALVNVCKKSVIQGYFGGDVENLTRLLYQILKNRPYGKKCSMCSTREAVIELLSAFSVYRTYISDIDATDKEFFKYSLRLAKKRNKEVGAELDAIEILLEESASSKDALQLIMRLQQFTGSIMAKGLEDTLFYVYNRLLSLNEVGGEPAKFGLSKGDFHIFLNSRQANWPMSLNATSTHDTKRGEDARARIDVLSEVPSQFFIEIKKWSRLNLKKRKTVNSKLVPNRNEEYYIYQALIGSFPFNRTEVPEFTNRLTHHMTKAVREAKVNSSWISPNLQYEKGVASFVTELLELNKRNAFLHEFMPFQKKIAFCGFLNSLSQTLIKITSPGIPDFYQGTELWDLNFVDPDNRRQVDFQKRQRYLDEIQNLKSTEVSGLLSSFEDGRVKIFEINKALEVRNKKRTLFQEGSYIPLRIKGSLRNHVIAFCRKKETSYVVIIAPRFLVNLTDMQRLPFSDAWKDTFVCLPKGASKEWNEIFTGKSLVSKKSGPDEGFYVAELLQIFPVALLLSGESRT
jgi:(1->4)-alpha-D-glucan 1-alpha-D-glucosylmutase